MATETIERSAPSSGDIGQQAEAKQSRNPFKRSGSNNPDAGPQSLRANLKHAPGYDAIRRGPESTMEKTSGREKKINKESKFSEELVDRFTQDLKGDMEQLMNIRKDSTSAEEFNKFLRESGHGYYVDLYNRMVGEKPGTKGRELMVKDDVLEDFMHTDKGLTLAYQIRQYKLQEQAMAAAIAFGMDPDEPEDNLGSDSDYTTGKGKPLWEAGRRVSSWWTKETGKVHGREKRRGGTARLLVGTNGRTTLTIGGLNILAASVGGATAGPLGAILGPVAIDAVAGLKYGSKRGEVMTKDISADALKAFLGDPGSKTPGKRGPDTTAIKWMEKMHNVSPKDYEIDAGGNVRKRADVDVVGGTGVDRKRLEADLIGHAKDILAFQSDNNIPSEYRRPMDVTWLLEGSKIRPKHGTEFEQNVMEAFNPNRGGILDRGGNTVETNERKSVQIPVLDVISVPVMDFAGVIQLDPRTGNPLTQNELVPRMVPAVDASGAPRLDASNNPIMVPEMQWVPSAEGVGKLAPDMVPGVDNSGNPIDVPNMVPLRDSFGNTRVDASGAPYMVPSSHLVTNADIVMSPILDANGNEVWEANPDFDWNNVDVAGNVERWRKATESVLSEEVSEVFQNIVDGNTDYAFRTLDKINEAKAANRSGKLVEEARKKMTKEKEALDGDVKTIRAEDKSLNDYQVEISKTRAEITKLERQKAAMARDVTISGVTGAPDIAQVRAALNDALKDGNTTEITIKGQSITSIAGEYKALEGEIQARLADYNTKYIEPISQALSRAEGSLSAATTNQDISTRQRTVDRLNAQLASMVSQAQQNEDKVRASDEFQNRAKSIDRRRELIESTLSSIAEKDEAIKVKSEDLLDASTPGRKDSELFLMGLTYASKSVEDFSVPAGTPPGSSAIDLRPSSIMGKSFESLVKDINTAHDRDPSKGWPASENTLADNRMMLLHAMTEARANTDPSINTPGAEFTTLTNPAEYGFNELDILALNEQELADRMTERNVGRTPPLPDLTPLQLRNVKDIAYRRMGARQRALQRVFVDVDRRQIKTDEDLGKLDKEGLKTPQLDAIQRAVNRFGPIAEEIMDQMPESADIDTLMGVTRDPAFPEDLSRATVNEDIAYENIMDLIFKHKRDHQVSYGGQVGTAAAFERNKTVLGKDELNDFLIDQLDTSTVGGSLADTLKKLRAMDKSSLARIFSEGIIFEKLDKKINT